MKNLPTLAAILFLGACGAESPMQETEPSFGETRDSERWEGDYGDISRALGHDPAKTDAENDKATWQRLRKAAQPTAVVKDGFFEWNVKRSDCQQVGIAIYARKTARGRDGINYYKVGATGKMRAGWPPPGEDCHPHDCLSEWPFDDGESAVLECIVAGSSDDRVETPFVY